MFAFLESSVRSFGRFQPRSTRAALREKRGRLAIAIRRTFNTKQHNIETRVPLLTDEAKVVSTSPISVATGGIEVVSTPTISIATSSSTLIEEAFTDFDAAQPAVDIDLEEHHTAELSWRRTPSSKVRRVQETVSQSSKYPSTGFQSSKYPSTGFQSSKYPSTGFQSSECPSIDTVVAERRGSLSEINTFSKAEWHREYTYMRNLTPGNQGRVDIYRHDRDNGMYSSVVIVKKIQVCTNDIPQEVRIMKDCLRIHPNIVGRFGLFYEEELQTCNIVLEYCSGGDLFDFTDHWLYKRNEQIPEIFMLHFIADMAEALGYLHLGQRFPAEGHVRIPAYTQDENHAVVLHRDIKLENIFLRMSRTRNGLPDIVLGDFGGAVLETQSAGGFGTSGYFAPEVLRYMSSPASSRKPSADPAKARVMTKASDVYTFGACLCYMMMWGDWNQGMDIAPAFRRSNLRNWPLLLDLLDGCLEEDPQDRPCTEELLAWAPVLNAHIRFLYQNGVRMPEGSYPLCKAVADTAPVERVCVVRGPPYSATVSADATTTASDGTDSEINFPLTPLAPYSITAEPTVQRARLVTFRLPSSRPQLVSVRKPPRLSSLFDMVERVTDSLVTGGRGRRIFRAVAEPTFKRDSSSGGWRSRRAELVSKFSDDSVD